MSPVAVGEFREAHVAVMNLNAALLKMRRRIVEDYGIPDDDDAIEASLESSIVGDQAVQ